MNAKLQANQSLSTQESRLAVIKRRAYAVACAVGLLGIAVGFLGISDVFRLALYGFLFVFTGITLSMVLNPKIRGWVNYYTRFYRDGMLKIFYYLNVLIRKWIRNKYRIKRKHAALLKYRAIREEEPTLFYHWKLGIIE